VHLLEWPEVDAGWSDEGLWAKWQRLRAIRTAVTGAIEPLRREKFIGSSLEAEVTALLYDPADLPLLTSTDFAVVAIVSAFEPCPGDRAAAIELGDVPADSIEDVRVEVRKTENEKCGRCWRHLPEVTAEGALCARCDEVVNG
jgi:isoleucyl-tRNA synthetase